MARKVAPEVLCGRPPGMTDRMTDRMTIHKRALTHSLKCAAGQEWESAWGQPPTVPRSSLRRRQTHGWAVFPCRKTLPMHVGIETLPALRICIIFLLFSLWAAGGIPAFFSFRYLLTWVGLGGARHGHYSWAGNMNSTDLVVSFL